MLPISRFALIGHPRSNSHLYREIERKLLERDRIPDPDRCTDAEIEALSEGTAPFISDFVEQYSNIAGKLVSGMHIGVPITESIIRNSPKRALRRVEQALMLASRAGANVAVLGGLTSGIYSKRRSGCFNAAPMIVTSGSTLTSASAVKMIERAVAVRNVALAQSTAVVIGASGDVGRLISLQLGQLVRRLHLVARGRSGLESVASALAGTGSRAEVAVFTDLCTGIAGADIIVTVSSTSSLPVGANLVQPGALVCDVGYPRNIAAELVQRKDLFVFRGGLMKLPYPLKLSVDLGLESADVIYGCFAEGIVLAMSGSDISHSDRTVTHPLAQIDRIYELARDYGFIEPCPFGIAAGLPTGSP
jgi:fatty aldehyde-generating acyl-ACP reductase